MTAIYDPDNKVRTWKGSYSDLSGPALAAHSHAAEMGKNGSIVIPIFAGADKADELRGQLIR